MNKLKQLPTPYLSLGVNMAYAVGNCLIGLFSRSWWFVTIGAYYAILSAARFCILMNAQKSGADPDAALFAKRVTGILLIALSFCLIGINILSAQKERGTEYHEIIMIAIAAYSFSKLTLAIIGLLQSRRGASLIAATLRNLTFADSVVSIYSLQRSMLVSFPGMQAAEIHLFNILTGTGVWIAVLLLGLNLTGGKHINMAKSKIVSISQKIAGLVAVAYGKIKKGTVDSYQKVEQSFIDGYTKIEDRFVGAYLTREGETVKEAKERLRRKTK